MLIKKTFIKHNLSPIFHVICECFDIHIMTNTCLFKYAISIFSIFTCISCSKTDNGIIYNAGVKIYVAGDNGSNPVLWKNGVSEILSSTLGSASKVILSEGDVYVAGTCDISAGSLSSPGGPGGQYAYWKNGIQNNIGVPGLLEGILSISVAGNDLYYSSGYQLWENGKPITLQGQGSGHISSIITNGTDVYIAGSDSVGDAVYWKNGRLNVVAQGYYPTYSSGSDPSVSCMYVSGNDVYIGGTNSDNSVVYWKNGVATYLPSNDGSYITYVSSIFVSGNDVYVAGSLLVLANGGSNAPAYWKNGVEFELPLNGAKYGNPTSIFVSGSDVYVSGSTSNGAVYWKNNVETILSNNGNANSIIVQ